MPIHNGRIMVPAGSSSGAGLAATGAFYSIEVHVPPEIADLLSKQGQPIPAPIAGFAVVDTGATLTCIDDSVLTKLGLNPVGTITSGTAKGPVQQSLYPARIVFPAQAWTLDLQSVAGVDLSGQVVNVVPTPQPIIGLVGRNFLERCVLIWNGPDGSWTLSI